MRISCRKKLKRVRSPYFASQAVYDTVRNLIRLYLLEKKSTPRKEDVPAAKKSPKSGKKTDSGVEKTPKQSGKRLPHPALEISALNESVGEIPSTPQVLVINLTFFLSFI
jgi:hypothetical protein